MQAIILDKRATYTLPPVISMRFQDPVGVDASSAYTELLVLPLFTVNPNRVAISDSTDITWKAYSIEMISVAVSCSSEKYTAKILDSSDISLLNTIDEVYSVADISYADDRAFVRYSIQNYDNPTINQLYFYLKNDGINATGPISIEINFIPQKAGM